MTLFVRTSDRTAVGFGCLGSCIIGSLALAVVALGGALALGAVALVLGVFIGWFTLWVMPGSLYRAFTKEFGSPAAGVCATLVWFGFCALIAAAVLWIL
jgi:hypothetical protein